jgi:glycosyltransferase involved in cell wall biosynthesis
MKLGFFSTEYFRKHPGMAESDRELCKEFARIGYDVRAVVEDRRVPRGQVLADRDGPVRVWRYQTGRFHPLSLRTYADKLLKGVWGSPRMASLAVIYRRFLHENPDLDLLQVEAPFPEGALVAVAARRQRKPFVISARGWESLKFSWIRRQGIRWALHQATAVRPNSPAMERLVVERFGVEPRRVRIIPTNLSDEACPPAGVDLERLRRAGREELRRRTGLPHAFILVAVSRFVPGKGLEDLAPTLQTLRGRGMDVGLVLCGSGVLQSRLRDGVQDLGLGKDVHFAGRIPHQEIRSMLAGADLLVIPSHLDSAPRAAIEAAAVGTPSVLTSSVGCAQWMVAAGAGRAVPSGEPEALAEAIRGWLAGSKAWAEASRHAVAWAATFRVEEVAKKMAAFHRDVLAGLGAA